MKHGCTADPKASVPVDSGHEGHVKKHRRALAFRHPAMLESRRCEGCGGVICCFYGQKTVPAPEAIHGVWLLHPHCEPPTTVSGTETGSEARR